MRSSQDLIHDVIRSYYGRNNKPLTVEINTFWTTFNPFNPFVNFCQLLLLKIRNEKEIGCDSQP